jgi:poly-gamma-glutamate synthesis protein (capsule biosynthesis protein)
VRAAIILLAAIALMAGACSDDDADATPTPAITETPASTATVAAPATASPSPLPTTASPSSPTVVAGQSITISAVGDVSLARQVVERMQAGGAGYPYALIQPLLKGDIVIGTLEGALTDRGDPWPKGYNFRTPPAFASGLRDAGFDVVSLANNHTMDFGVVGLQDSLGALAAVNVARVGAGENAGAASAPVIVEANGLKVAFIGCVQTPQEGGGFRIESWAATATTPGLYLCEDGTLAQRITEVRAQADFVIVMVHAGSEYINAPDGTQRRIAASVLAAGADAYIGHHAHVVQPVEQRGPQLIAWGLGNFIFDLDNVDLANIPQPRVSLVLEITLTKGAGVTSWEALPVVLDDAEDRPRRAAPLEAAILDGLLVP